MGGWELLYLDYKTNKMNKLKEIWKDPVWSKVISAGIILLIATIWAKFINISFNEIYNNSISFLNFTFPIYYSIVIIFIFLLIRFLVLKNRNKNPYANQIVGNYSFGELSEIMMNKKPKGRTTSMEWGNENTPNLDYLTLFYNYYSYFNRGITLDDDYNDRGFIYGILCPDLVGYGLLDKIETRNEKIDFTEISYQISQDGKIFHSLIEKSNIFE